MKRVLTATCLAASFAVGLAAQSTGTAGTAGTTSQDPQAAGGQRGGGPRTVTGCLRAGDTAGTFMLTDVTMQGGPGGGAAGSTAGAAGSTAGGATAGGGTAAGAGGQGAGQPPMSITLSAQDATVDLKAHVGHKVEVVGTMAGGGRRGGAGAGSTGTATGTTASGTTTSGGTTAGTATGGTATGGTATATGTGSTSGTGTAGATGTGQGGGRGRSMNVTSLRMISNSCS